jgi:hypothetical protein
MFQDFGNLSEPGRQKANQQGGKGDEDHGAVADKTVGLGRGVKDGPKYIHPTDHRYGEKRQPQAPLMVIRQQMPPGEQKNEKAQ